MLLSKNEEEYRIAATVGYKEINPAAKLNLIISAMHTQDNSV